MAHVYVSDVIAQPVDRVWTFSRDYNGHGDWHPIIEKSEIEGRRYDEYLPMTQSFAPTVLPRFPVDIFRHKCQNLFP